MCRRSEHLQVRGLAGYRPCTVLQAQTFIISFSMVSSFHSSVIIVDSPARSGSSFRIQFQLGIRARRRQRVFRGNPEKCQSKELTSQDPRPAVAVVCIFAEVWSQGSLVDLPETQKEDLQLVYLWYNKHEDSKFPCLRWLHCQDLALGYLGRDIRMSC